MQRFKDAPSLRLLSFIYYLPLLTELITDGNLKVHLADVTLLERARCPA